MSEIENKRLKLSDFQKEKESLRLDCEHMLNSLDNEDDLCKFLGMLSTSISSIEIKRKKLKEALQDQRYMSNINSIEQ